MLSVGDPLVAHSLLRLLILLLFFACLTLFAQTTYKPVEEASPLPPTTGDPLTVTPKNYPEVSCTIVDWNPATARPSLTVLCPPQQVFAPIRVYLKLSWLKPEDIPGNTLNILAEPKTPTKLRTSKRAAQVWLRVFDGTTHSIRTQWVNFNGVVDMALLADNRSR